MNNKNECNPTNTYVLFMALITTLVLCASSQDFVMSVSVRRVHVILSTLLDLRAEERRVVRRLKPPRCGEVSRRPRALSRVRTQVIGALSQGSYPLSYPKFFSPYFRTKQYLAGLSNAEDERSKIQMAVPGYAIARE